MLAGKLALLAAPMAFALPLMPLSSVESECSGRLGSGVSQGQSPDLPGCGEVTVRVEILPGSCHWVTYPPCPTQHGEPKTDCTVEIHRTWTNIAPGKAFTGCVIQNGQRYCIDPPLASSGGTGSDEREYQLECGSGIFPWSSVASCASAPGGRITALAAGHCDACPTGS